MDGLRVSEVNLIKIVLSLALHTGSRISNDGWMLGRFCPRRIYHINFHFDDDQVHDDFFHSSPEKRSEKGIAITNFEIRSKYIPCL